MLIALIANLQNPTQPQKLPTVKIDRGGGGAIWPRYDIVDIVAAAALFPEVSGVDSAARAARRTKWIGQALPFVKDAREKREAVAFMAGAQLAEAVAEERHAATVAEWTALDAQRAVTDQLKIEQIIEIIDSVRGTAVTSRAPQVEQGRRGTTGRIGLFVGGLVVGGLLVGIALSNRRKKLTTDS